MEDPNLLDAPLSTYNGEVVFVLTVPVESMKGSPEDAEAVAQTMAAILRDQLSARGVHLPLILTDWELEETEHNQDDSAIERADVAYESKRDER